MAIDLSTTEPRGLFGLVALFTVIAVWVLFFLGLRWTRWRGLDGQQKATVARLRQHIARWSPAPVTIPRSDSDALGVWRDRLHDRAHGDGDDQPSIMGQVKEVWAELAALTQPVPRLAVYLASEAVTLAAAVGLVVVSAPAIRAALQGADVGPMAVLAELWGFIATAVGWLWGAFPGTNVLWALLTLVVLQGYAWATAHALEVAALLLGLACGVAILDRYAKPRGDRALYPRRRQLARRVGGWLAAIYLAGAIPTAVGEALGRQSFGVGVGGTLAFILLAYCIGRGQADVRARLHATARLDDVGVGLVPKRWAAVNQERLTVAYLLLRRVALAAGLAALPVVIYFVVTAVIGGHLTGVLGALLAAPLSMKVGILLLTVAAVGAALTTAQDAATSLASATHRSLRHHQVRVAVFLSVGPAITGLVTATILLAFRLGLVWSIVAGIVMAILVRLAYRGWQYTAYKAHTRTPTPGVGSVSVAGPTRVDLPTGDIWVARVNATEYAWPDLDGLVEDVIAAVEARLQGRETGPQPARLYRDWIEDTGETRLDEFRNGQSAEARSRFIELIVQTSGRIDEVDERLEQEYGETVANAARRFERAMGHVSQDDRFYHVHEGRGN